MKQTDTGAGTEVVREVKPLLVARKERQNQFARNNPALQAALDKMEDGDILHTRGDLQGVNAHLLRKLLAEKLADPDKIDAKTAGELLSLLRGEEMHQAKLDKLKADTESVLVNVATPTALRQMWNEYGMCIQRGTEAFVESVLKNDPATDSELVIRMGAGIYNSIMEKLAQSGYADESRARMMNAPR